LTRVIRDEIRGLYYDGLLFDEYYMGRVTNPPYFAIALIKVFLELSSSSIPSNNLIVV
jgi:hypothetical protein